MPNAPRALPLVLAAAALVATAAGSVTAYAAEAAGPATHADLRCASGEVRLSARGAGYPAGAAIEVRRVMLRNHMEDGTGVDPLVVSGDGSWAAPVVTVPDPAGGGGHEARVTVTGADGTELGAASAACPA